MRIFYTLFLLQISVWDGYEKKLMEEIYEGDYEGTKKELKQQTIAKELRSNCKVNLKLMKEFWE